MNYESPKPGFDTDTMALTSDEMSFALGKEGSTRRKIVRAVSASVLPATASSAAGPPFPSSSLHGSAVVLEFVGSSVAFLCGHKLARKRMREYLDLLLRQRRGSIYLPDKLARDDCTVLEVVQSSYMGLIRNQTLRALESETDTFLFVEGDPDLSKTIVLLGGETNRAEAERKIFELIRTPGAVKNVSKEQGAGRQALRPDQVLYVFSICGTTCDR